MNITGANIGSGARIQDYTPAITMYSLLSTTGKSAYSSTTVGNWFNVTAADYAAVVSGLTSVTKYGLNDTQLAGGNSGWSSADAQAWGAGLNAQLASGTYIIGFVSKTYTSAGTITPLISTSLPPTATYSPIANSASVSNASISYFLRRAGSATAVTSYLGIIGSVTMETNTTVTGITNWYSSTGSPNFTAPWTAYNANPVIFQVLGTPTYQWS